MDFVLSLTVSTIFSALLLFISFGIYLVRLRKILPNITQATANSLQLFALSLFFLALVATFLQHAQVIAVSAISLMFGTLIASFLQLVIDDSKKMKISLGAISTIVGLMTIESFLRVTISVPPFFLSIGLPILMIISLLLSLYLVKESFSPFSVSGLLLVFSYIIAGFLFAVSELGGFPIFILYLNPKYFFLQVLPFVIGAAILASLLRPWRYMVLLGILFFTYTIGLGIMIPAFVDGNILIFQTMLLLTIATTFILIPLDFFLGQVSESKAKTPRYISITLVFVAIISIAHTMNYSFYLSYLGNFDEGLLYFEWILGVSSACTFFLAAASVGFSKRAQILVRESLIAYAAVLFTLGFPFVRLVQYEDTLITVFEWDTLFLLLFFLIFAAFFVFFGVARKLIRAGAPQAAVHFMTFMFASFGFAIVAMFIELFPIRILTFSIIGIIILLILGTPRTIDMLFRFVSSKESTSDN
ncbi:MAG: membrane protein of unknown function [Candidatus Thorarchaeota archaeon]|nr:MAG: membrane protein of unknown function [Candidatus Thorarchaeota archaeon]